jgi:hypothetical protein
MAYKSQITVTRPANTTAYAAGDVVGGVIAFTGAGPFGAHCIITGAALQIDVTAVPSGMTSFRLHLYSATPPSALADNAAWTFTASDRAVYLGYIDLGSPALQGTGLYCQIDGVNHQVLLGVTSSLFGYLVTNGGYTPAAVSETYVPALYAVDL